MHRSQGEDITLNVHRVVKTLSAMAYLITGHGSGSHGSTNVHVACDNEHYPLPMIGREFEP